MWRQRTDERVLVYMLRYGIQGHREQLVFEHSREQKNEPECGHIHRDVSIVKMLAKSTSTGIVHLPSIQRHASSHPSLAVVPK
jgi:hypothetical protein